MFGLDLLRLQLRIQAIEVRLWDVRAEADGVVILHLLSSILAKRVEALSYELFFIFQLLDLVDDLVQVALLVLHHLHVTLASDQLHLLQIGLTHRVLKAVGQQYIWLAQGRVHGLLWRSEHLVVLQIRPKCKFRFVVEAVWMVFVDGLGGQAEAEVVVVLVRERRVLVHAAHALLLFQKGQLHFQHSTLIAPHPLLLLHQYFR